MTILSTEESGKGALVTLHVYDASLNVAVKILNDFARKLPGVGKGGCYYRFL